MKRQPSKPKVTVEKIYPTTGKQQLKEKLWAAMEAAHRGKPDRDCPREELLRRLRATDAAIRYDLPNGAKRLEELEDARCPHHSRLCGSPWTGLGP